ncbi:hypothetical protein V2J09_013877 [Rumex salicifolius]
MNPSPVLDEVYQLVLEDEQQRELNTSTGVGMDSTALNSYQRQYNGQGRGQGTTNFINGNREGYSNRGGVSRGGGNGPRPTYFCDHCKRQGHTIDRCYRLHGFPDQKNEQARIPRANAATDDHYVENPSTGSPSNSHVSSSDPPALTHEQYNQLIALLGQPNMSSSDDNPASMLAGKGSISNP